MPPASEPPDRLQVISTKHDSSSSNGPRSSVTIASGDHINRVSRSTLESRSDAILSFVGQPDNDNNYGNDGDVTTRNRHSDTSASPARDPEQIMTPGAVAIPGIASLNDRRGHRFVGVDEENGNEDNDYNNNVPHDHSIRHGPILDEIVLPPDAASLVTVTALSRAYADDQVDIDLRGIAEHPNFPIVVTAIVVEEDGPLDKETNTDKTNSTRHTTDQMPGFVKNYNDSAQVPFPRQRRIIWLVAMLTILVVVTVGVLTVTRANDNHSVIMSDDRVDDAEPSSRSDDDNSNNTNDDLYRHPWFGRLGGDERNRDSDPPRRLLRGARTKIFIF